MNDRLFSEKEIAEMEMPTLDRLNDAIEMGDKKLSKKLATKIYKEYMSIHDLYSHGSAALFSFIGRKYGDDVLEEAMIEWVRSWWLPVLQKLPKGPEALRHRIKMFIGGLNGHFQPLRIIEDSKKITIQMLPCGSGGRLIIEGKYQGSNAFLTLNKPQRLTYGRPNHPVYCTHEPIMELLSIQEKGFPFIIIEPSDKLGEKPCSFIIYKDPKEIPEKYFDRLEIKRPLVND